MDPFQVEILSDVQWWLPWLPVLGSGIIAMVTFIGITKSNKTNRDAIDAADDRELGKWRRETILKLSSEAAVAALDISRDFRELITREYRQVDEAAATSLARLTAARRHLPEIAVNLRFVGATELADKCDVIAHALVGAWQPGVAYAEARSAKADEPTLMAAQILFEAAIGVVDSSLGDLVSEAQNQLGSTSRSGLQPK